MSERQRGLGRGLSALLGENVAESAPVDGGVQPTGVRAVPIESLKPNPDQPRKYFSAENLEELTASIRDKGVLQPILVRAQPGEDGMWQIIAGERRWRAAQAARLKAVPIIERAMDDVEVMEVAIIENVQRADLNPVEEAQAYAQMKRRILDGLRSLANSRCVNLALADDIGDHGGQRHNCTRYSRDDVLVEAEYHGEAGNDADQRSQKFTRCDFCPETTHLCSHFLTDSLRMSVLPTHV